MGAGWNVRRVYELATGKYFKQAAHDDMIQPDYLRQCVDALEADESLVLAHSLTRVIDENGQFIENYDDGMRTSSLDPVVRARDLLLKGHRCYPIFGLIRLDALHKLPPRVAMHTVTVFYCCSWACWAGTTRSRSICLSAPGIRVSRSGPCRKELRPRAFA